jgi:hypothetical protein
MTLVIAIASLVANVVIAWSLLELWSYARLLAKSISRITVIMQNALLRSLESEKGCKCSEMK